MLREGFRGGHRGPFFAAPGGGGGGGTGAQQPGPLEQVVEQIVDRKIGEHKQQDPHIAGPQIQTVVDTYLTHHPPQAQVDVVGAIQQRIQDVANLLRPHLRTRAQRQGFTEQEVRTMARDEAHHEVEDRINDDTIASGTQITALLQRMDAAEQRLPAGASPLATEQFVRNQLSQSGLTAVQTQELQQLLGVGNLTEAEIRDKITERVAAAVNLPALTEADLDARITRIVDARLRQRRFTITRYIQNRNGVIVAAVAAGALILLLGWGMRGCADASTQHISVTIPGNNSVPTNTSAPSYSPTATAGNNSDRGYIPDQIAVGSCITLTGPTVIMGDVTWNGQKEYDSGPGSQDTGSLGYATSGEICAPYGAGVQKITDPSQLQEILNQDASQMQASGCVNGCRRIVPWTAT